jgi:hypothetical protein
MRHVLPPRLPPNREPLSKSENPDAELKHGISPTSGTAAEMAHDYYRSARYPTSDEVVQAGAD